MYLFVFSRNGIDDGCYKIFLISLCCVIKCFTLCFFLLVYFWNLFYLWYFEIIFHLVNDFCLRFTKSYSDDISYETDKNPACDGSHILERISVFDKKKNRTASRGKILCRVVFGEIFSVMWCGTYFYIQIAQYIFPNSWVSEGLRESFESCEVG